MSELEQWRASARAWMAQDPESETRSETETLLQTADADALKELFSGRLTFGTAGMRGTIGPGPNQMNALMVRWVTTGLAQYIQGWNAGSSQEQSVVIGFDGRRGSRLFADHAADVLAAAGFVVYVHEQVVPTPVLAHAVPELGAAGGIMVTASHNPPKDNGYKVYWSNGAQIIPPHDSGISDTIDATTLDAVGAAAGGSLADRMAAHRADGRVRTVPAAVYARYVERVLALRVHKTEAASHPVRAVYTAMHGVGAATLEDVVATAGHHELVSVPEQRHPDPAFPTVSFPNPEEPGALDLSMALATKVDADIIVAHDPDADRLAVAVPDGAGGWRQLTGNQVGVLLAEDLLTAQERAAGADRSGLGERLVATTIVSSSMLSNIAKAHGVQYAETLTGFKWIANAAIDHDGPFVVGYEEALGYSIGPVVRDKDGVSAALVMMDLVAWCKARESTLWEYLGDLYRRYGLYVSAQQSFVMPGSEGAARIREIMANLRADAPEQIGGVAVRRIRDIQTGTWRDLGSGETGRIDLPASNVLAFDLVDGSRVLARPSGTEPKVKFYFEVREQMGADDSMATAELRGMARLEQLKADFVARATGG